MMKISQGGLVASMVVSLLLVRDCSQEPDVPFTINKGTGEVTFTAGNHSSCSIKMFLNGKSVLVECSIFQETDSTVCINSLDGMDIISVFKEILSPGCLRVNIVNAGKENCSINDFRIQAVSGGSRKEFDIISKQDKPWSFCRYEKNDTLQYSLQNFGVPVILLPGERLELPQINLVFRSINSTP